MVVVEMNLLCSHFPLGFGFERKKKNVIGIFNPACDYSISSQGLESPLVPIYLDHGDPHYH